MTLALGHRSVRECQKSVDSREFSEWLAYDQLEPIGQGRADWGAAMIASVIANVNRSRGHKAFTPDDFLPQFGTATPKRKTTKQLTGMLNMLAANLNAKAGKGK